MVKKKKGDPVIPENQEENAFSTAPGPEEKQAEPDPKELELNEYKQQLYRLQADFDNYRKRVLKDQSTIGQDAVDRFIAGLLPVIDNLERAISAARDNQGDSKMLEGVEKIYRQLRDVLEREGIQPMECVGEHFDPACHQAIYRICVPEQPENTVMEEAQRGYRRSDRVIRPAMVVVSTQDEE